MGNKTSILSILYSLFPLNYERYIEPFGGSGAVLLGKPVPDKFEVLNDYNRNLVNLYRCMRDRPVEFICALGFLNLNARDDFNVLKKFFRKEEFDDAYFQAQLELTEVLLPPIEALRDSGAVRRSARGLRPAPRGHVLEAAALQLLQRRKIVCQPAVQHPQPVRAGAGVFQALRECGDRESGF